MGIVTRPPERIDRLVIGANVLHTTLYGLALGREREMLCYWIGAMMTPDAHGRERAAVHVVAFPRIESGYNFFHLIDGQMGQIVDYCASHDVWVLAQVHTHPTDEPHSEADECWPVSHRSGFLSIVVPFFAQFATVQNPQWRVHELRGDARWEEIDPSDRLEVVSDVWLPSFSDGK